jgi:hypothetical protein
VQSFQQTIQTLLKVRKGLQRSSELAIKPEFLSVVKEALESNDPVLKRAGLLTATSLNTFLDEQTFLNNFATADQKDLAKQWRQALLLSSQAQQQSKRPLRRLGRSRNVESRRLLVPA